MNFFHYAQETLFKTYLQRNQKNFFDRPTFFELSKKGLFSDSQNGQETLNAFYALAKGSLDLPFCLSLVAHWIACRLIEEFASSDQKNFYLSNMQKGELLAAISNAEKGSGTDLFSITSNVSDEGESSIEKSLASNIGSCELALVSSWHKGALEVFVLHKEEFFQHSKKEQLLGFHTGMTGILKSVPHLKINPKKRQLGTYKSGFKILKRCFYLERLMVANIVTGVLEGILPIVFDLLKDKKSFNKPLLDHQYLQEKMVFIAATVCKLKALIKCIGESLEQNHLQKFEAELSVCKMMVIEDAVTSVMKFMEAIGHLGYLEEHISCKIFKDILAFKYLGGSLEQQKMIFFQDIFKRHQEV